MPLDDDTSTELGTNLDATPPSSSGEDVTPPASSGSEPEATGKIDGPASLEDAISAALAADDTAPDANPAADADADADADPATDDKAEAAEEKSDDPVEAEPADGQGEVSEEELSRYGKNAQRRIRQLLDVRADLRKEVTALQGDATNYQQIRHFMGTNNLVDAEVADLFQLGADLKSGNPERLAKFLDRVMPFVQQAMEATGRVIPQDLQAQVDAGDMTEDAARRFSQTRTQATYAQQQAQAAQQATAQVQTQVAQGQIVDAVNAWQAQTRQSDPDFDLKAEAMQRVAQALVAERGLPATPAQAVEFAKAAHAEASKWMKSARPAPKATRPAPTSQTAPRSGLAPTATSIEAIINQAFGG